MKNVAVDFKAMRSRLATMLGKAGYSLVTVDGRRVYVEWGDQRLTVGIGLLVKLDGGVEASGSLFHLPEQLAETCETPESAQRPGQPWIDAFPMEDSRLMDVTLRFSFPAMDGPFLSELARFREEVIARKEAIAAVIAKAIQTMPSGWFAV